MNVRGMGLAAACIVTAAGALALGTTPAHASSGGWYAASICGGGYYPVGSNSEGWPDSTVYVSYNGSTDCVVTVKTTHVGTPTHVWARITGGYGGNRGGGNDDGYFSYYAGPVYKYAPGTCIEWLGGTDANSGGWLGHCG